MDGQRVTAVILALHVVGGAGLGVLYFGSLWWNATIFGQAGHLRRLLASMAARFVLLGGVLTAASFEGAMPLLATSLGVLLARIAVLRQVRMAAP